MSNTRDEVVKVVSSVLAIDANEDTTRYNEASWDSLKHVEMMFSLEDALGISFTQDELGNLADVMSIIIAAERHRGS